MAQFDIVQLNKRFGDVNVLSDINLVVNDGEFLVLVGPSGSGKSTLLRVLAGLEQATSGVIAHDGEPVTNLPPQALNLAMVFQDYALYPHMTVRENMSFGLRIRGYDKQEITGRVSEAAAILGLTDYLERKPRALSGGQRQRVAMGRAMVRHPSAYLFDEPLSNLDAKLRVQMRSEIVDMQRRVGATAIYVTHDQMEAMTMGDRIAVLKDGKIEQLGTPMELYFEPCNTFVAGFIGTPAMNIIPLNQDMPLDPKLKQLVETHHASYLGIRPEHLYYSTESLDYKITLATPKHVVVGSTTQISGAFSNHQIEAVLPGVHQDVGHQLALGLKKQELYLFDKNETLITPSLYR